MTKPYTEQERKLFADYAEGLRLSGIPAGDALDLGRQMIDTAIACALREGTYELPENFGDIILGKVLTSSHTTAQLATHIRYTLKKKMSDGVTRTDLKWWWNRSDVDRRMMILSDDIARIHAFFAQLRKMDEQDPEAAIDEALRRATTLNPVFGDPGDPGDPGTPGEEQYRDDPLPYELRNRIGVYSDTKLATDAEAFAKDIKSAKSANSFIRKEIIFGNL